MKKVTLYLASYISLVVFFCIMLTVIFILAGTMSFLQGWLYVISFAFPTSAITVYFLKYDPALIERRIRPVETRPKQIVGQSFAAVLFIGGIIGVPALDQRFSWTSVPLWLSIIADGLILVGFIIVFRVFQVNTFASRAIETMDGQEVISTGPYAIIRHPMYSGAAIIIACTPIALNSLIGLFFSLLLVGIIVLRILDEEKMLMNSLKDYKDYCRQTHFRLIPYIW